MGKYDKELIETASKIATPGKGILAADESTNTIGARFKDIETVQKLHVENNAENRRAYRSVLFGADKEIKEKLAEHISGVILFEETFYDEDGLFRKSLQEAGVAIGIKVDKGTVNIPNTPGETATIGLDDLATRAQKFYANGARFAKWRAVLKIDVEKGLPSELAIQENAHGLARYAAICQENGLVPIVEPEVLMDGNHSIEVSAQVTERVLAAVFKTLNDHHVLLEGILLKPNMVLAGVAGTPASPQDVAAHTVRTLQRTVPAAVPGIVFLSGGQSEIEATTNLNAINQVPGKKPWTLSFSYGRALQASVIQRWAGKHEHVQAARAVLFDRAEKNGKAVLGKYDKNTEDKESYAAKSLHQKNYIY